MNTSLRLSFATLLICILMTPARGAGDARSDSPTEHSTSTLILAGGSLPICSDLAPRDCIETPSRDAGARTPPRYRITPQALALLELSAPWNDQRRQLGFHLKTVLASAGETSLESPLDTTALEDILFKRCLSGDSITPCAAARQSAWQRLSDPERAQVLSALEVPQIHADGQRLRESAHPKLSREPHGATVFRAVVEAAASRSGRRSPRVLVVTASALDPMEAVDFYRSAFAALGADAEWLPLDAALAGAIATADCQLVQHRARVLGLHAREQVYPDLHAQQQQACLRPETLSESIASAQAIFFAGGDQWRLRQAFFGPDGGPLPWLEVLRRAHARGDLVVGGTSAGAAVQSGAAMLTNGSPASALRAAGRSAAPPAPGCARAGLCSAQEEEQLSYWAEGGLGLATEAIVDTHFSERAREPRLLRLLAQTGARLGYGADEASALQIDSHADHRRVTALGREGGWVFQRKPGTPDGALEAEVFRLGPAVRLRVDAQDSALDDPASLSCLEEQSAGSSIAEASSGQPRSAQAPEADPDVSADAGGALEPGATRAAARALAYCGRDAIALAAEGGRLLIERTQATRVSLSATGMGIGPLRLRWEED
ncbi:MAG: cyanophycinase [Lysobacterales bacterium]